MVIYCELTFHLIDFTVSQFEVIAMHFSSSEVVIISRITINYWLASIDKNQCFSKIWTRVTNHSHCISRSGDRIFAELVSMESEKKSLVIMHILTRLTKRLFGVTSKNITRGVIAHRHCGAMVVTSLVEGCTSEIMDTGLVQQLQFDISQLGTDCFLLASG